MSIPYLLYTSWSIFVSSRECAVVGIEGVFGVPGGLAGVDAVARDRLFRQRRASGKSRGQHAVGNRGNRRCHAAQGVRTASKEARSVASTAASAPDRSRRATRTAIRCIHDPADIVCFVDCYQTVGSANGNGPSPGASCCRDSRDTTIYSYTLPSVSLAPGRSY